MAKREKGPDGKFKRREGGADETAGETINGPGGAADASGPGGGTPGEAGGADETASAAGPAKPTKPRTGARRGRPPKSASSQTDSGGRSRLDITGAAKSLLEFHQAAAEALGIPFLQITPQQATSLAKAASQLQKHYPVPAVSGPRMALIWFAGVAGMIYVPKLLLAAKVAKAIKASRQTQPAASAKVVNLDGRPFTPRAGQPLTDEAKAAMAAEAAAAQGFDSLTPTDPGEGGGVRRDVPAAEGVIQAPPEPATS